MRGAAQKCVALFSCGKGVVNYPLTIPSKNTHTFKCI